MTILKLCKIMDILVILSLVLFYKLDNIVLGKELIDMCLFIDKGDNLMMRKIFKTIFLIALASAIFLFGLTTYSSIKNDRSLRSSAVELLLKATSKKMTKKKAVEYYTERKQKGEKKYTYNDSLHLDVPISKSEFEGMPVYTLNGEKNNGKILYYIHGGGYTEELLDWHWKMLNSIAKTTNSKIVIPVYPLAPFHTYEESYQLLTDLYKTLLVSPENKDIVMMGDSAGGGLALGLAQEFHKMNVTQPNELILLSPWVDISMTNPDIQKFEKFEPLLDTQQLIVAGELWAGKTSTKNSLVSPLYGEMKGLKNVTVFVGTREEFYPDILLLIEKMKQADIKPALHVGQGQNHVYPVFPVPEGYDAIDKISKIINEL